jgi:hypothetical protein
LVDKKAKKDSADLQLRLDNLSEYLRDIELKLNSISGKDTTIEQLCMALVEIA